MSTLRPSAGARVAPTASDTQSRLLASGLGSAVWLRLAAVLALAFMIRLPVVLVRFVVGTDEALYLTLAQSLAKGLGFTEDGVTPHVEFAPGYPLLASLVYRLGGWSDLPAQLNVLIFGPLLVVPIFLLARDTFAGSTRVGTIAALLVGFWPALVLAQPNFEAPTELLYMVLVFSAWWLLRRSIVGRSPGLSLLAGLCVGLAHLTRIEGLYYLLAGAAVLIVVTGRRAIDLKVGISHEGGRNRLRTRSDVRMAGARLKGAFRWHDVNQGVLSLLLLAVGTALAALPYALYVYRHTGLWLAPKAVLHQYHAEVQNDPLAFERAWEETEYRRDHLQELPGILEYAWQNRAAVASAYPANLWLEIKRTFTSVAFLTPVWLGLALLGIPRVLQAKERGLFLLPLLGLAVLHPVQVVDIRYMLPLLPAFLIFAATGLDALPYFVSRIPYPRRSPDTQYAISNTVAVFAAVGMLGLVDLTGARLTPRPTEYKALGLWMRENGVGSGQLIMARKRQVPFYAGGRWEWLPVGGPEEVVARSIESGAQYVVVDSRTVPQLRPELEPLLNPAAAPPGWEFIVRVEGEGTAVLYRLVER